MPNNQKGLAPVVIIVAVIVVAAIGGFLFMQKGKMSTGTPGESNSTSSNGFSLSLNSKCELNDPELCKFVNNWKQLKDYSVTSTSTDKSKNQTKMMFELSGEDKFHITTSEGDKEAYNVITIGDTTYTKDYSDNKWWKQVTKKDESIKDKVSFNFDDSDKDTTKDTKPEDKTSYKAMGKEACGSRQCFKYQVISSMSGDSIEYIWFDDKEYLLRKERTESKDGEVTESEFSYDAVKISAPSPVKEAGKDQVIIPGGGSMNISEEDKKAMESAQKDAQNMMKDFQNDSGSTNADSDY